MCGILGISIGEMSRLFDWAVNLFPMVQTRGGESWGMVMHDKETNRYVGARGLGRFMAQSIEGINTDIQPSTRNILAELGLSRITGTAMIMHGRLASRGNVTLNNAHPFLSCDGRFAMVHNGGCCSVTFNKKNHTVRGETDSEEIMHHTEELLAKNGFDWERAITDVYKLSGTLNLLYIEGPVMHVLADTNMHIVECPAEGWLAVVNMKCTIDKLESRELTKGYYRFEGGRQTAFKEIKSTAYTWNGGNTITNTCNVSSPLSDATARIVSDMTKKMAREIRAKLFKNLCILEDMINKRVKDGEYTIEYATMNKNTIKNIRSLLHDNAIIKAQQEIDELTDRLNGGKPMDRESELAEIAKRKHNGPSEYVNDSYLYGGW